MTPLPVLPPGWLGPKGRRSFAGLCKGPLALRLASRAHVQPLRGAYLRRTPFRPARGGLARGSRAALALGRRPLRVHAPLETELGKQLYGKRQVTIEPVFANTKFNRRLDRFLRRGRAACRSEWRLISATHNLLKLHRSQNALAPA
jgi:hypothetical protein